MNKGPMAIAVDKALVASAISDAEREAVLKANAMLTLADHVEIKRLDAVGTTARISFTLAEMDLICYALRHTADSDN